MELMGRSDAAPEAPRSCRGAFRRSGLPSSLRRPCPWLASSAWDDIRSSRAEVSHAFQSAPSNVARDLDVARIGTLQGPERDAMLGQLLDRLPAFRNREAGVDATRDRALMLATMLAGSGSVAELDPLKRTRMLADQLAGRPRQ